MGIGDTVLTPIQAPSGYGATGGGIYTGMLCFRGGTWTQCQDTPYNWYNPTAAQLAAGASSTQQAIPVGIIPGIIDFYGPDGTPGNYTGAPIPDYLNPTSPNYMGTSAMVAPGGPATPTVQQIAGGQTITPNVGTQISNVAGAAPAGFTMPTILSESSVAGIPNWMLIAGAVLAVMMLKK